MFGAQERDSRSEVSHISGDYRRNFWNAFFFVFFGIGVRSTESNRNDREPWPKSFWTRQSDAEIQCFRTTRFGTTRSRYPFCSDFGCPTQIRRRTKIWSEL